MTALNSNPPKGDDRPLAWHVFGENVRGASHLRAGTPSQDAIGWQEGPENGLPLIIAVADGHGSSTYYRSDRGAKFAVEVAVLELTAFADALPKPFTNVGLVKHGAEKLPRFIVEKWRKRVEADLGGKAPFTEEEYQRFPEKDRGKILGAVGKDPILAYGATLLAVLVTSSFILYLQLGDGDILMVTEAGQVTKPVPGDARLLANETTSLCSATAMQDFRKQFHELRGTPPALILLSTDGYSNSFASEDGFLKVGSDVLRIMNTDGVKAVEQNIPVWLNKASEAGSGDDITLGVLCRLNAVKKPDVVASVAAIQKKEEDGSTDNSESAQKVSREDSQAVTPTVQAEGLIATPTVQAEVQQQSASPSGNVESPTPTSSAPSVQDNMPPQAPPQEEAKPEQYRDGSQMGNARWNNTPETTQRPASPSEQEQHSVSQSDMPSMQPLQSNVHDGQTQVQHVVLRVSQSLSKTSYTTIGEALKFAQDGARIEVQPGTYHEKLVIERNIELIAVGSRDPVIVVNSAPCVRITAQQARIVGFKFQAQSKLINPLEKHAAVEVENGSSTFHDCHITNTTGAGIFIRGQQTAPTLSSCHIQGCKGQGILFSDFAAGKLQDCHVYANKAPGVEIITGANPHLIECHIDNGDEKGVFVWQEGAGTFEKCFINANRGNGLEIRDKGNPTLRKCAIRRNKQSGVVIVEQGQGTLQNCYIESSDWDNVMIQSNSAPHIWGGGIVNGKSNGIVIQGPTAALIEGCDVQNNAGAGVVVLQTSQSILRQCHIIGNNYIGVAVKQGGSVTLEGCRVERNINYEVRVIEKSTISILGGNILHMSERDKTDEKKSVLSTILISDESKGLVEHCHILTNGSYGVWVHKDAELQLRTCAIQSRLYSVAVSKRSMVKIDSTTMSATEKAPPFCTCERGSTLFIDGDNVSPHKSS